MTVILQNVLAFAARLWLLRNHPKIVAITGNVGKTSTKDAAITILGSRFSVRGPERNFNNEIGVPLTILGWKHHGKNVFAWLWEFIVFPFRLIAGDRVEILILEFGADRPGDIKKLTRLAPPHIAIVTAVGDMPVHVEFFDSPEALADEKANLVRVLAEKDHAILNVDDPRVLGMRSLTKAHIETYGTNDMAGCRVEDEAVHYGPDGKPEALSFKIAHDDYVIPVRLRGSLNRPQALAVTAAYAAAVLLGMTPIEIVESLRSYQPPPGRMRLIPGNKYSLILDDTYNAAPESMESALQTLASLKGGRRIAVLGDMLELGEFTESAHRRVGKIVAETCSLLFTVGARAKFIREEAITNGFPEHKAWHFLTSKEVDTVLEPMLSPGDLVLVKGSQGIRMERVVQEVMAEPWKAKELLCRQSRDWLRRP